ncbi:universal stress protein [Chryseobacterium jejuense]|uniref:Nucleotide-binding universal stress protein, UspA family n=1 Tax=Chryseobacterium jejuense TaxID=445960 RepID=A0A2X2VMH3_CHRJE|nr:universal stress protein [Chryseobacterium jejuense]SDI37416.1 Nucleotide-binding universal stress protein, UspA family [Chryseobacterium jejuense]SQB26871.1 Universal stress protein family [Chryseobacterium jejuense]
MRTILVPIDFTSTTENAVKVAAEWAKHYEYQNIILLKIAGESEFDYLHIAEGHSFVNEENVNNLLKRTDLLFDQLSKMITEIAPEVKVSRLLSDWALTRSINEVLKNQPSIEMIVLGSDDSTSSNESFVSDNIISIARTSPVKTLIVPNSYQYNSINNIVIPCDINGIKKLERLFHHKSMIQKLDVHLSFLNINTKEKNEINSDKKKELEDYIQQHLTEIPSSIHYSYDENVINGILSFATSNNTDLIIALPGRHSFLYYMASRSISEGLYQNTNLPVLILK